MVELMITEIEVYRHGPLALATFAYERMTADPENGYPADCFEFDVISYAFLSEITGRLTDPVPGDSVTLTPYIREQLADAVELLDAPAYRACDITKPSPLTPLFESFARDFGRLIIKETTS
tara:strand:- start:121 stop:483 length:363 start_codon:yes stop_codon:yes gene_type:complete